LLLLPLTFGADAASLSRDSLFVAGTVDLSQKLDERLKMPILLDSTGLQSAIFLADRLTRADRLFNLSRDFFMLAYTFHV